MMPTWRRRDPAITRENAIQGTPASSRPSRRLAAELDGRADIYATGCVAYWLLTGQLVFTADTAMAVLMKHVHTVAGAPSSRIEERIPAALDR